MKFHIDGKDYWYGRCSAGYVIYDPSVQAGMEEDRVLLFVIKTEIYDDYHKSSARTFFSKTKSMDVDLARSEIKKYHSNYGEISNHRTTHCYSCHSPINSNSNRICSECGWIICNCGACGCQRLS